MSNAHREFSAAVTPSRGSALCRWCSQRPILTAVLLAVLLGLAELPFATFMADDLIQLGALEGVLPGSSLGPLRLYTISDGIPAHVHAMQNAGALPWFFSPDFKMAFFRPLSSALLAFDHALWGLRPIGYRLQATLWFVALVGALAMVLRRVLPGPIGALALIVFAVSGIHASLFWNATRHVVVAGALGMLALAAHIDWRESTRRSVHVLSVVGFVLALCASEAAFGIIAYLVAYESLYAVGDARTRLRALAPTLALVVVYTCFYALAGLGSAGSAGYADPLRAPLAFLAQLPGRWLFLVGSMVGGGGADLWLLRADLHGLFILIAALMVVMVALLLRATWATATPGERRGSRWLIVGALAAALPFAGTPIGSRCLVLPMLGGSVAIAFVLQRWWAVLRQRSGLRYRLISAACVFLAVIHLALAPLGRLTAPYLMREMMHERLATAMQRIDLDPARLAEQRVVVLRAPDFIVGLGILPFRALYRLPLPRSWRTLAFSSTPLNYTRTAERTLELALAAGTINAPGLNAGDVIDLDGMRVSVLAHDGAGPTRVAFDFDRPLEDPSLVFLTWNGDRFDRVVFPPTGPVEAGVSPAPAAKPPL